MITIGYNNKFSSILRSLCAVAIGLLMVISTNATETVVKIIAAFLFAAGVVSFAYGYFNRKNGAMSLMAVNAVVDIIIGLLLYFFPGAIAGLIVTIIGVLIILFAVFQLIVLSGTLSLVGRGGFSMILALLVLLGGITLLFNPFSERVMSIMAGIFLIIYGISDLISAFRVAKAKKVFENESDSGYGSSDGDVPQGLAGVKDAEYHKE